MIQIGRLRMGFGASKPTLEGIECDAAIRRAVAPCGRSLEDSMVAEHFWFGVFPGKKETKS